MSVATWWASLCAVAVVNIAAWTFAATSGHPAVDSTQLVLSGIYVFGCAFRSALPVCDIPRLCLADSWASSVLIGRSVATVAELAFAVQWAVYLHASELEWARELSLTIVPLIVIAELFSWHAVLTTKNLGHVFENSLWGVSAALIVISLVAIASQSSASRSLMLAVWAAGGALYVAYIFIVDVPMYWSRWRADEALGRQYLSLAQGTVDASRRSVVSMRWEDWRDEVVWMSLYFSVGVWVSISLVFAAEPK
ncbi:MAG: hypothetical protein H7Y89_15955 [Steroidobacteraceae bacterium]|nr:hypothetical protein [Steroidobacteraceae bacterium]